MTDTEALRQALDFYYDLGRFPIGDHPLIATYLRRWLALAEESRDFKVQLSTDEDVESLEFQYWHQDLLDFVWAKGGWAWFVLVPIDPAAITEEGE